MNPKTKKVLSIALILATVAAAGGSYYLSTKLNSTNLDNRSSAQSTNATNISIDPKVKINDFSSKMRGIDLAPWEHSWGRPFLANVNGIKPVLQGIKPGLVRYSGGLWINNGAFVEGLNQQRPNEDASKATIKNAVKAKYPNDNSDYGWNYGIDEIDSLGKLAQEMGFEVMVQVNVVNNNPQMWADMVKYAKSKNYPFNYWEMGNELDLTNWQNQTSVTPDEYAQRVLAYSTAMKAENPSIKIISGVPAYTVPPDWINQGDDGKSISPFIKKSYQVTKAAGKPVDAVSYHWYQIFNDKKTDTLDDVTRYVFTENGQPIDPKVWNNSYSRIWGDQIPPRIKSEAINNDPNVLIGVSELNVDSNSDNSFVNQNHIGALWQADQIGRLAYAGADFSTIWMGYSDSGFGMITHKDGNNLQLKSTYYTSYMYEHYFGDTLVGSSSSDKENVAVWASTDTSDPNKLKLMVINYSTEENNLRLNFPGFSAKNASIYKLTPTQTVTSATNINQQDLGSRLNGVELTPSNISNPGITPVTATVNAEVMDYAAPAFSVTSIVLDGTAGSTPAATATTTASATNTPIQTPETTTKVTTTVNATPSTTLFPTTSTSPSTGATTTTSPIPSMTVTTTTAAQPTITSTATLTTTSTPLATSTTSITQSPAAGNPTSTSGSSPSSTPASLPNTAIPAIPFWVVALLGLNFLLAGAVIISFQRKR